MLLFAGALFARSLRNLSIEDTGVGARGLVVANMFFRESSYPLETRAAAYASLEARLAALPGVSAVAEAFTTPLGGSSWGNGIAIDGTDRGNAHLNQVSADYFATLGTPLLAGRVFDDRDTPGSTPVAVVSRSFADHFFAGSPIGHRFGLLNSSSDPPRIVEVVGVVADQKYGDMREAAPRIVFLASAQDPAPGTTRRFVVRSSTPPAATIAAIGAALAEADPIPSVRYAVLDTQIGDAMLRERLMARLSAIFSAVALLLAIVGLYGVVSYMVASRRAEIGVRMALGAGRSRILAMILGDVGRILMLGVMVGAGLAVLASRGVASLLYGLEPHDPMTLIIATEVLTAAGLVAAAIPAKRAAGIDPAVTLRAE